MASKRSVKRAGKAKKAMRHAAKHPKRKVAKHAARRAPRRAKAAKAVKADVVVAVESISQIPVKPKKNYKLPNYKKKCIECAQFKFIKGGWSLCMQCYEKRYGKYTGEDRFLYVK